MFQLGRYFIKFEGIKYYKSLFSSQQRYLTQVKVVPLIGYPLLKKSQINFFYSQSTLKDYYKLLDVPENATQEQIKKQFHKLAKLYHPDSATSNGDDEKFKEVSEAYNIIGDQNKRIKYDSDRNLYKQQQEQSRRSQNQYSQSSYYQSAQRNQERRQQHEEYETYNPYNRSKQQSAQDEQRYKTHQDYQGFQNRDFDQRQTLKYIQ